MFSYVFMKLLERRPRDYDRRMHRASGGRLRVLKQSVAEAVPEGARVLDVGCGTGELAELLVARSCHVVGFDASPAMVAAARQRAARPHLEGRFEVREMSVDGMDTLPEAAFDAVVSTLVFSELDGNARGYALRHALRVLRPGGVLAVAAEVWARTRGRRLAQRLVRAPLLAATYLGTGEQTRPVADLAGAVAAAGFVGVHETRSHGDTVALVVARRPRPGGGRDDPAGRTHAGTGATQGAQP